MFGSKLRSWMDAVRSRKKQHRKEKQGKSNNLVGGHKNNVKWDTNCTTVLGEYKVNEREVIKTHVMKESSSQSGTSGVSNSRYSANNLSSPESAYSTGYSTDGTSPGAPPENLLNTSKATDICHPRVAVLNPIQNSNNSSSKTTHNVVPESAKVVPNHLKDHRTPIFKKRVIEEPKVPPSQPSRMNEKIIVNISPALGVTSPRQRNRIRTNPWLPGSTLSPSPVKHDLKKASVATKSSKDSPKLRRFLSPAASRRRSLSTSSSSSLSATSVQLEMPRAKSISDEDCTLNEMMGKYDESYVYEKETDILSDSDPTDCETDIDTGQDGGDEDETLEGDLDFIDNGSLLEIEARTDLNTGHCSYYSYDVQRKRSSRKKTQRRNNKASEKKRKCCLSKKRQPKQFEKENNKRANAYIDGSKSAGATPVSVRRANCRPISKLTIDDCLRKRSNSVGFYRDPITTIDKRDKEADLKYRELITEAEQILRAMKTNGLSPRRVPGPANKRVELLRITECAKPEIFVNKTRPSITEDSVMTNPFVSKIPSNNGYNCPRFSPKKNHITKFIISNSPVLARKEWEIQQSPIYKSPLSTRKQNEEPHSTPLKEKNLEGNRMSPKHRRKPNRRPVDSSSDSDEAPRRHSLRKTGCPQSEPLRRKVYNHTSAKTVAFNMAAEETIFHKECTSSSENLRQQVLLNTIVNLKRNLEDHSASLKQVYRSSHNIYA
ncbi:unnamed protein product [Psylliodes chrysocephalus]|uniref:Uncharacterized protein n=1 Tax=Psylliodes chrysocephalus TaxID=3402493 RepID=A0A9P0CP54_9CUCU|nr:unnamed protein product [Psylliodes chrysocephala]